MILLRRSPPRNDSVECHCNLRFKWIQIEVSSLCQASCIYCPHTAYRKLWKGRLISKELFEKLVPMFSRADLVFLQGWGEPFLHPDFFDFVHRAKDQETLVGTTTNGMLITKDTARRIVDSALDIISFSLAASSSKNDVVRQGTSIDHVLKAMEWVRNEREKQGVLKPRIHVSYLLLKSLASELEDLPELVSKAGAEKIVISTLSLIPDADLEKEAFSSPVELREAISFITSNLGSAREIEIEFENKIEWLRKSSSGTFHCPEIPTESFFVGSDGRIAPCVFLGLPLKRTIHNVVSMSFGSLAFSEVETIWHRPSYQAFREGFVKGPLPFPCARCARLNTTYSAVMPEKQQTNS
ncbi:MAG: radical SAM/SPASM domain-containing protein [Thermodesulforhabdaceae bacterium]